jgi:hypothetical protein
MKNALILLSLILAVLANSCAFGQTPALPDQFGPHKWTATVKVIGEDGNPVVGADVAVSYTVPTKPNSSDQTYGEVKGLTDTNGMFSASHTDSSWDLGVVVGKSGYYTTHWGHPFYFDDKRRNPSFTLLLKQIGRPIALYAKKEEVKMPKENEPVGFDLLIGDWVAPYGEGKTVDMLFTVHRKITNPTEFDADLELTFPNQDDGIVVVPPAPVTGSPLLMPRTAPDIGYQSTLKWSYHNFAETFEPGSGYFFRVRTVVDANGSLKSSLYGKIQGEIRFLVGTKAPSAAIAFNYYLNPTPNDQNLEFDPTQNLFKSLAPGEKITVP